MKSLGNLLARLGGANSTVLARVASAKGRFIQMGLVLLSTAGLAVVSMSFALIDGLKASPWVAIPLGFIWGFVILNLDRLLIQNIRPSTDMWRTLAMVVPRLLIAALLGIVIATPLVLRVFSSEIYLETTAYNAKSITDISKERANSAIAKQVAAYNKQIADDQAILNGDVPGANTPNVVAAQANLAAAQTNLTAKRKAAQDAYDQMICELDGNRCHGASGKHGDGPRYKALKRLYNIAVADEADAQQAVKTAQKALDDANKAAAVTNSKALADAQSRARLELAGLIANRDKLEAGLEVQAQNDNKAGTDNVGLLAQIDALGRLGRKSSSAFWAHWTVAGLLFMIELLPVLVKFLSTLGPPTIYDRVSELQDDSAYDAATQQRNIDRQQIEEDSKKRHAIEADMRQREEKLGIMANAHVAGKMKDILDVALTEWSDQVAKTLHGPANGNGTGAPGNGGSATGPPANGSSSQSGAPSGQPGPNSADPAVRKKYNLPNGGSL